MELEHVAPEDIEKRSLEIITQELGSRVLDPETAPVIKRAIHATADFDYAEALSFSSNAVGIAVEALLRGAHIVTDTQMALSGVNKRLLQAFGGEAHCFMSDAEVGETARQRKVTRASICMERAAELKEPLLLAIGNAPTALVRLYELMQEGRIAPVLIIGAPVGFVNVVEAKELIMSAGAPYIVARGRKGGSGVAAAITNALLLMAQEKRKREEMHEG